MDLCACWSELDCASVNSTMNQSFASEPVGRVHRSFLKRDSSPSMLPLCLLWPKTITIGHPGVYFLPIVTMAQTCGTQERQAHLPARHGENTPGAVVAIAALVVACRGFRGQLMCGLLHSIHAVQLGGRCASPS